MNFYTLKRMKTKLLFLLPLVAMISCGPSQEDLTNQRIQGLTKMAELGTVEYTVKKIIKTDDAVWWKWGKRKIVFTCKAFIKAGIDLNGFSAADVDYKSVKNQITIKLPKAKILSFNMPAEEINLEFSKITGFRDKFSPEQKQQLLVLGENDIRGDKSIEEGILADAEANARLFFSAMFSQLGYETVIVNFE